MECREAIYVDESTIDFPIFLLFFLFSNFLNPEFPIFLRNRAAAHPASGNNRAARVTRFMYFG